MRMLCYKCHHPWNYKGKKTEGVGYVTCPSCLYKLRVDKALIENPFSQKLLTNFNNKKQLPKKLPNILPTTNLKIEIKETPIPGAGVEEESYIKILPPKFEIIRVIPRDPMKIIEHQRNFF